MLVVEDKPLSANKIHALNSMISHRIEKHPCHPEPFDFAQGKLREGSREDWDSSLRSE